MLRLPSRKAQGCKDFFRKNGLNPVMLVLIGKLSLSTLIWVLYARVSVIVSVIFQRFLHHFVLAKLATSSIKVKNIKASQI